MPINIGLACQKNNFVGPEYWNVLKSIPEYLKCKLFLLRIDEFSEKSKQIEIDRTGGEWNPEPIPENEGVYFDSLKKDNEIVEYIRENKIHIMINGGCNYITENIINASVWINIHPGKLPEYAGSSAPERAIKNGDDIWLTAHQMSKVLDKGPILAEQKYCSYDTAINMKNMRAGIYKECAQLIWPSVRTVILHNLTTGEERKMIREHPFVGTAYMCGTQYGDFRKSLRAISEWKS